MNRISECELEIMKVLWKRSPLKGTEVADDIQKKMVWETATVRTLIQRLVDKGFLIKRGTRRSYTYTPAVSEEQYRRMALNLFIERVFNADIYEMLDFISKTKQFSEEK